MKLNGSVSHLHSVSTACRKARQSPRRKGEWDDGNQVLRHSLNPLQRAPQHRHIELLLRRAASPFSPFLSEPMLPHHEQGLQPAPKKTSGVAFSLSQPHPQLLSCSRESGSLPGAPGAVEMVTVLPRPWKAAEHFVFSMGTPCPHPIIDS